MELVRAMIDHKKVLVTAMNGPGVGAGAAWFQGSADLLYAAEGAWLQVTFSQMGLVPENGAAVNWAQSMGVHRANDWLLFGGKASVEELKEAGLVNKIFPQKTFHADVHNYLKEMLKERSGKSMMEMKRLQNKGTRDARILSLFEAWQALSERFVDGEPMVRMKAKMDELAGEFTLLVLTLTCSKLTPSQRSGRPVNRRSRDECFVLIKFPKYAECRLVAGEIGGHMPLARAPHFMSLRLQRTLAFAIRCASAMYSYDRTVPVPLDSSCLPPHSLSHLAIRRRYRSG